MATSIGEVVSALALKDSKLEIQAFRVLRAAGSVPLSVRLTPNQNIILCDVPPSHKCPIITALAQAGLLEPKYVDHLNLVALACPAMPLCPLAITEAERGIPDILKRIRAVFDKVGVKYNEAIVVRITGCPNGCARPYMAELELAGNGPNSCQIWLGGTPNQTVLARTFGFEKLQELVDKWEGPETQASHFNLKLFVDKDNYEAVEGLANVQNKTAHQLAVEVVRNYVASQQNGKSE